MDFLTAITQFKPDSPQESVDQQTMLLFIKKNLTDVLLRDNKIAHLTSSSLIFNPSKDKLLMIYHNIYQSWSWTGGHADGDKDLLKVAVREAKEETGIKNISILSDNIIALDILPVFGHVKNHKPISAHLHLSVAYAFQALEDEPLRIKPDENSGVRWIAIDQLADYISESHMRTVYNKIINKVVDK